MDNVTFNYILTYFTYKSFGSIYSFNINVYGRSYFPVLTIKHLIKKDGDPTTSYKLATGMKH